MKYFGPKAMSKGFDPEKMLQKVNFFVVVDVAFSYILPLQNIQLSASICLKWIVYSIGFPKFHSASSQ